MNFANKKLNIPGKKRGVSRQYLKRGCIKNWEKQLFAFLKIYTKFRALSGQKVLFQILSNNAQAFFIGG